MKARVLGYLFLAVLFAGLNGCCHNQSSTGEITPGKQTPSEMPSNSVGSQSTSPNPPITEKDTSTENESREAFTERMQKKLDDLQAEIENFETRLKGGTVEFQARYENDFKPALKKLVDDSKAKLAELKNKSEPEWEEFKRDMESAFGSLREAFDKAVEAFK